MLQLFQKVNNYLSNPAVISDGLSYSYSEILTASRELAPLLLAGKLGLQGARVAFMVPPGIDFVKVQWAIWQAGGVAVPLCLSHPLPALNYTITDSESTLLIASPQYKQVLKQIGTDKKIRLLALEEALNITSSTLPVINNSKNAMILYTSGTTSKPKGVVITHAQLEAQISTLVSAWELRATDHALCVLPLHHVHGIVNVVSCALWVGATCEFISEFDAEHVFKLFEKGKINVFMAVPTIYFKLIAYWELLPKQKQEALTTSMKQFRLMVCGSAALPVSIMKKWEAISGHTLLERYGMTEIGMAISNPYQGERRAGYVGLPLPGVSIRLVNEQLATVKAGEPGEILVKGNNVFNEYWNKPEATTNAFTTDGWFKTGDVAVIENGYYRIMGRHSVDIIKSGGYKISALEIEEELRMHDQIIDCAVVGIPDEEWGERIVAALVVKEKIMDTDQLNTWLKNRIAAYKIPKKYVIVDALSKNDMGKVTKNDIKKLFTA